MVFHRSCRLSLLLFIFFPVFPSKWIISKLLSSNSQILLLGSFWCWWCLLHFLFHSLRPLEFCLVLFHDFSSLLNFSFCSCIVFLLLLTCLFVFSYSSLKFVKQIFWILYQENHRTPCLWGRLLEHYLILWLCHVSLIFFFFNIF